jgi:hypothetical protein
MAQKSIIYSHNARFYIAKITLEYMEHNSMSRASHIPYLYKLTSSDFYLVEYLKQILAGSELADQDELVQAIDGIFRVLKKLSENKCFLFR